MTGRQQLAAVGAVLGVLAAALAAADWAFHRDIAPVTIGTTAPAFHAQTIGGPMRAYRLAEYRGQVVVLNVWATWCEPCRVEMPSLEALYRAYGPRGLRVIAVSIDDDGHDADIQSFTHRYGLTFDVLHDGSGAVETEYQTTGVSETFVIARDGVIRKKVAGAEDWASQGNQALIAQLLNEPVAGRKLD
jgi:cytochrome c biogenesis protein CcmG, thiol:disulfide interchange protein DsbE